MKNQMKSGVLIGYINIVLSMCANIFLTPLLISSLSDECYSIYKVMQAFAGPLIMLNLGIATIVTRCIAKYRSKEGGDIREKENTLALCMLISTVMAVVVLIAGLIMRALIPKIYGQNYSPELISLAQEMFLTLIITTALNILMDTLKGCVLGNERFLFSSAMQSFQYVVRFGAIWIVVQLGYGALAVTRVDLIVTILIALAYLVYVKLVLHEKVHLYCFDKKELAAIASFSLAILLQAIINQVNNNVDTIILGAYVAEKEMITMYASALSIYSIYNSIVSVFSGVYLPKTTKMIEKNSTGEELTDFVIVPGRIQAIIVMAVLCGFTLFGKNFITVWIGEQYINASYITLMLLIPVSVPLVQNICLCILDAQLKRLFRSVTLFIMAVLNVLFTLIFVRFWSYWGAAIGTVLSLTIGHIIIMNIYYQKVIHLNVFRMFREMFRGTAPAALLSSAVCVPFALLMPNTWLFFIVKCMIFLSVFMVLEWKMGLNQQEKNEVRKMLPFLKGVV